MLFDIDKQFMIKKNTTIFKLYMSSSITAPYTSKRVKALEKKIT